MTQLNFLLFFNNLRFLCLSCLLNSFDINISLDSNLIDSDLVREIEVLRIQPYIILHLLDWEVDVHIRSGTQVAIDAIVRCLQAFRYSVFDCECLLC